jgi:hypothetical protein
MSEISQLRAGENRMKIGTKSLLFGAHQFVIHPISVAIAWRRLYGRWPNWWQAVCIAVHDWGYWGCPNMDGPEGTNHPEWGARLARCIVGRLSWTNLPIHAFDLCSGHPRHYARLHEFPVSPLMPADKLGAVLPSWWVYLPMARATGELAEYRAEADRYFQETGRGIPATATDREWYTWLQGYMARVADKSVSEGAAARTIGVC